MGPRRSAASAAIWISVAAAAMTGCGTFRPNPGRVQVWAVAAHAGQFYRAVGRWPADARDLASLPCPRLDEINAFEFFTRAPAAPCDFVATLRYTMAMSPRDTRLDMTFRGADAREVCRLRVDTPANRTDTLAPMVRIHTTVFACPGEGEFQ